MRWLPAGDGGYPLNNGHGLMSNKDGGFYQVDFGNGLERNKARSVPELDLPIPTLDKPTQRIQSYALPLERWNRAVATAMHLSRQNTISPL